jgi:arginase
VLRQRGLPAALARQRGLVDAGELAAAGVASLDGQLAALIRPAQLTADRYAAALAGLPPPWWLHTDLDVLATAELAAVDYPQPGGLTWAQLTGRRRSWLRGPCPPHEQPWSSGLSAGSP